MRFVSFHTFGCRLNQAETGLAAADLAARGYKVVDWGKPADLLVINSCTITATAAQKTRQAVRAARRRCPESFIVVIGCGAAIDHDALLASGEADLLVPHPAAAPLSSLLPDTLARKQPTRSVSAGEPEDDFQLAGVSLFGDRTRANLKIQDGCDFYCSYCIVPHARGRSRSRAATDVLREAQALLDCGFRELVLCGVNLTTYRDQAQALDLTGLLRLMLRELRGDYRLRLGSAEPAPVLDSVIDLMADDCRLCRFLHLPLQYGEDNILRAMRRHYTTDEYRRLTEKALTKIDGLCLGADVMVGFPGETEANFAQCQDFLSKLPFGLLHVFTYSPRPGTPAAEMSGRPNGKIARQRAEKLLTLADSKTTAFANSQIGKVLPVLIEDSDNRTGWSDNYLQVQVAGDKIIAANELLHAEITAAIGGRKLQGRLIERQ